MKRRLHYAITTACHLHDPAAAGERPRAVDQRRGIVLSMVRHDTGDQDRSVLYQASLSELFVPYQDPDEPWNHQAYLDLGTYPSVFGGVASAMEPGKDCPSHASSSETRASIYRVDLWGDWRELWDAGGWRAPRWDRDGSL